MSKIFGVGSDEQSDSSPAHGNAQPAAHADQSAKHAAISSVDVTVRLDNLAKESKEKLNWKTSIVDLMKLVGMDSSLPARKELAEELHYTGDSSDSASMNIWLHQEVLKKIAENGGSVPASLTA